MNGVEPLYRNRKFFYREPHSHSASTLINPIENLWGGWIQTIKSPGIPRATLEGGREEPDTKREERKRRNDRSREIYREWDKYDSIRRECNRGRDSIWSIDNRSGKKSIIKK